MAKLAPYRKAAVAVAAAGVLIAGQLGLEVAANLPDAVGAVFDGVVGILSAFGVFRVPNVPAPPVK